MNVLPAELTTQIYTGLDLSTKAQWHCVCSSFRKPVKAEGITAAQALKDGHLAIFQEYKLPLLSNYYKCVIKGKLAEQDAIIVVQGLINSNVRQSVKLSFLCVKYNKEYLYKLIKKRTAVPGCHTL